MMKVLFIGGTGNISSAVSELAIKKGAELYLFNRNKRIEFVPSGAKIIQGDIRNEEEAAEKLEDYSFDVVVDWIAYTTEHVKTDLRLFKGKTKQYIFISTASAYQKPVKNFIITEETPLDNPYWDYSRDKIACEELLFNEYRNNGFPVTIVRPSHTYGDTFIPCIFNSRKSRWSVIERMKRGKAVIVPGDGTSIWVLTHNTDFARAFAGIMGQGKAIGQAYHITSQEALTWDEIIYSLGEAAGLTPAIVHISTDFLTACLPERKGELYGDKINSVYFDNSRIRTLVPDFKAEIPLKEGLKSTIRWYLNHPEHLWIDEEWDQTCDRLIAAHKAGIQSFKEN
ncbi:MAG: SDR family oxidoreductase [Acetivibrionales bacterium]